MAPITLYSQGHQASSAHEFLTRTSTASTSASNETPLLQAIRLALRGSDTELLSSIQSTSFQSKYDTRPRDLTWNAHTVIISYGGVMVKKWNFQEEGESIQWACLGELEQSVKDNGTPSISHSTAYYASYETPSTAPSSSSRGRPTFGPFSRETVNSTPNPSRPELVPAVFVFLRSIGKIYLQNGLEFTFSLPFIVRKAWPISPHGVMMQRVLEPSELLEAEMMGDSVLPTIFSITSPFAEPAAVGLTTGIIGSDPPTLKDEDENSSSPLKSVIPTEMVVWTSHRHPVSSDDVLVTVDVEKKLLSIWRYVYIKPKDTPVPLTRTRTRSAARKRQSLSGVGSRRTSAIFPLSPHIRSREHSPSPDFDLPEMPPLSSLPGMPPTLSTTTTIASLISGTNSSQRSGHTKGRRNSLTRNDLSMTLDRMALGGRLESDMILAPIEHGRMKAAYWMESVHSMEIPAMDASSWLNISVCLFDSRSDGKIQRCLMAVCLPNSQVLLLFSVSYGEDKMMKISRISEQPALSITSICATRKHVWDLLVLKPGGDLILLTHGTREIPIQIKHSAVEMEVDSGSSPQLSALQEADLSLVTLIYQDGRKSSVSFELFPKDWLTNDCLELMSVMLPSDASFSLHKTFMEKWASRNCSTADFVEFQCFTEALYSVFDVQNEEVTMPSNPWLKLARSSAHDRLREDPALRHLRTPPNLPLARPIVSMQRPHPLLAQILYGLHMLGEQLRLSIHRHYHLVKLVPVICRLSMMIRPEWADFWKRLVPDALSVWPSPANTILDHVDDRLPVWPPDESAILYGRASYPDSKNPWNDITLIATRFDIKSSFEYGAIGPLQDLNEVSRLYSCLSDGTVAETQKRAENAILAMVGGPGILGQLPLGIAAPLREAARTCQLAPPGTWPLFAYRAIGRNDLAASASDEPDTLVRHGYQPLKYFTNSTTPRRTVREIVAEAKASASGEVDAVSGVELHLEDFTDIRFGQDRRLEEVARILCSSTIPSIKIVERPELSEHDQTKEHQNQVIRVAERTLALPYGRAMFTFGSVPTVTREAYTIPKIEYTVRMQPLNITVAPEAGKLVPDSINWGEFHNGVAAGLRISPTATGVESSWIAFNKPSELTPEHAGFLLGLGLTGHLKEMLTWHTFAYLTPKHDLTSIGVLLGLSSANVGNGNQHVTKLLAVHTPALLPTPTVDLNVSLLTQAAGLSGVGLLYLGTRNRRMAEVCLNQISRHDLVQPDLSNEHREAYTYASALAFGMIMLGKGTTIPADMAILKRLTVLIHGDENLLLGNTARPLFDTNLTSPAATIALGLMYLRTERQDIADILTIPDTVLTLDAIQPSFLTVRTIARSLIMWSKIAPTNEWYLRQIPVPICDALEARHRYGKPVDDAIELAHYNILAGCCFALALKYAGTARQEVYQIIVRHFDNFTRLAYASGPAFDHKIKRSAVREGLNLISISLSMVMAGTGEITCLRRIRYAYGMYQQVMYHHGYKYGVHIATHMAMGLLFLGGGRYTLGTSDAAIACMVTAFFPRSHQVSSDNKSFLQALRHLWVLAVEPRCLIARDVDTNDVVYLPVKISVKESDKIETTQLISPTLIPDVDKLMSIRVDTPRYWPFYLDTASLPRHKEALLRSQTLYVKRRTAFLSYTEDPKGSRSLFVRSGSSAGDAAMLDFPQITDAKTHPAGDLSEFITSFSNNTLFLAFADHFSREEEGVPEQEKLFYMYCHAALLDSILQDKPQTLQSHLTLWLYRNMSPQSRYFHLRLQDLRFAADFYSKVYDRRFSGRAENNPRPPLLRDTTVLGALHALDRKLDVVRETAGFQAVVGMYARGEVIDPQPHADWELVNKHLAWYLLRDGVPSSTLLVVLRGLARDAHAQCAGLPEPEGTTDVGALDLGIKEVLHATGSKMSTTFGSGWSVRSLDEIIKAWKVVE